MIKLIWSLDTFPITNNRWSQGNRLRESILMTALSVLYAHLWYDDIELYVDSVAYKYLHKLPVRITKVEFNRYDNIWMNGKLQVMEMQKRPFAHIDGDVFLKKPINKLYKFKDVVVERFEKEDFESHYHAAINYLDGYLDGILPHWNTKLDYAYNCGVFGFNNIPLMNDYLRHYKIARDIYLESAAVEFKELMPHNEPCIVLEQFNLACFLNYRGIRPDIVLAGEKLVEQNMNASLSGYCHLLGISKYNEENDIEGRLRLCCFPFGMI